MQKVYYSSFGSRTTYSAFYDIAIRRDQDPVTTDIVVIHSPRLGPLVPVCHVDNARDTVLNKILSIDLQGVVLSSVRFFVLIDTAQELGRMDGYEFDIHLDFDDYKKKGNPYFSLSLWQRVLRWPFKPMGDSCLTRDVVGGCAKFFTNSEQRRHVLPDEVNQLCSIVGYEHPRAELPNFPPQLFFDSPPTQTLH